LCFPNRSPGRSHALRQTYEARSWPSATAIAYRFRTAAMHEINSGDFAADGLPGSDRKAFTKWSNLVMTAA
jgi:hypothetical protein